MSRSRKNKLFDLFKSSFHITLFYKPTNEGNDIFYYIILDDILKLKIMKVKGVYVIDDVIPLTSTYIKQVYEKVVNHIKDQSKLTILVSLTGNTIAIQQACVTCGVPLVTDERYLTIPLGYYNKLKSIYGNDTSKYGFYILSVGDEDNDEPEPEVKSNTIKVKEIKKTNGLNNTPIGVELPIRKIQYFLKTELDRIFQTNVLIDFITENSFKCQFTEEESFVLELLDSGIYIKDLFQSKGSNINLVKMMDFVNVLQKLIKFHPKVYIINVQNWILYGICNNKEFIQIQEGQKLPVNKLFKQAFQGFGSFQLV